MAPERGRRASLWRGLPGAGCSPPAPRPAGGSSAGAVTPGCSLCHLWSRFSGCLSVVFRDQKIRLSVGMQEGCVEKALGMPAQAQYLRSLVPFKSECQTMSAGSGSFHHVFLYTSLIYSCLPATNLAPGLPETRRH